MPRLGRLTEQMDHPGIVGYDDTVVPELNIAILAQHDILFLGEKGQAKSRLMRLMASSSESDMT